MMLLQRQAIAFAREMATYKPVRAYRRNESRWANTVRADTCKTHNEMTHMCMHDQQGSRGHGAWHTALQVISKPGRQTNVGLVLPTEQTRMHGITTPHAHTTGTRTAWHIRSGACGRYRRQDRRSGVRIATRAVPDPRPRTARNRSVPPCLEPRDDRNRRPRDCIATMRALQRDMARGQLPAPSLAAPAARLSAAHSATARRRPGRSQRSRRC